MNTLIDIVKSDMGYFVTAFLCVLFGFGAGCGITGAIFRWEGDRDETDNNFKHDRISAAQTIRQMRIESERKRSKDSRSGKEDEHQDKGQQP